MTVVLPDEMCIWDAASDVNSKHVFHICNRHWGTELWTIFSSTSSPLLPRGVLNHKWPSSIGWKLLSWPSSVRVVNIGAVR